MTCYAFKSRAPGMHPIPCLAPIDYPINLVLECSWADAVENGFSEEQCTDMVAATLRQFLEPQLNGIVLPIDSTAVILGCTHYEVQSHHEERQEQSYHEDAARAARLCDQTVGAL